VAKKFQPVSRSRDAESRVFTGMATRNLDDRDTVADDMRFNGKGVLVNIFFMIPFTDRLRRSVEGCNSFNTLAEFFARVPIEKNG
jgi:hypothetical protein